MEDGGRITWSGFVARRSGGLGKYRMDIIIRAGISFNLLGREGVVCKFHAYLFFKLVFFSGFSDLSCGLDSGVVRMEWWFCEPKRLDEKNWHSEQ